MCRTPTPPARYAPVDNVLVQGDNMLLNAFNIDLIPCEGILSLNKLPTVTCCRWLKDKSNNSSIEICRSVIDTNMSPVEAQKYTIDLSIGWLASLAELLGLTTFIFPRNRESDICAQVFIL